MEAPGRQPGEKTSHCDLLVNNLLGRAERELAAFTSAVNESFGPGQACLAAADWIDLLSSARHVGPAIPDWRYITILA